MAAKNKRTLKFRTEAQRNPLLQARLTEADFVRVQIVLDSMPMTLSLNLAQMIFVKGFSNHHRRMDANGVEAMPFKPKTYVSYEHFIAHLRQVSAQPGLRLQEYRTDEGELETKYHDRLMELLAYACLPVWAKDEKAYIARWGRQDKGHDFRAGTAWDIVEKDSMRRAA